MTLNEELRDALNAQIGMEFQAFYSYLSMSSYFEANAWDGFAQWMAMQSGEEREHAMKFYTYLLDRGATIVLPAIEAPAYTFDSPLAVFKASLAQEQKVTAAINRLYKIAHDCDDYATVSFLKWFVDEQVEEEKTVSDMIEKIKRANANPEAMMLLDRLAGERQQGDEA
ncbi:ferritin [Pelagicoccus sp. SDUM812003]|uniref:ferritin n=1 Tax=Pelagicoccus sp. SDUM812003 TaxID=3041267 RepID=UPI00280E2B89|nr:ferritin [Pelagicoccus sp. SDUM812003]MDQ8202576.1 ferritin [Pelagicoccus sp. SDUM812003]